MSHVAGLPLDDKLRLDCVGAARLREPDYVSGRADRGERIAQLVAQHREETVLRPVCLLQRALLTLDQRLALVRGARRGEQGLGKRLDFIDRRCVDRELDCLAHRFRRVCERSNRIRDPPIDQVRTAEREQDRKAYAERERPGAAPDRAVELACRNTHRDGPAGRGRAMERRIDVDALHGLAAEPSAGRLRERRLHALRGGLADVFLGVLGSRHDAVACIDDRRYPIRLEALPLDDRPDRIRRHIGHQHVADPPLVEHGYPHGEAQAQEIGVPCQVGDSRLPGIGGAGKTAVGRK